jgi:hypothetical protein
MLRTFRFWLTLASILVCLFNYFGFDRDNLLFFMVSVPAWIIEMYREIYTVNRLFVYAMTILFYFLLGYTIDYFLSKAKKAKTA